MSNHKSSTTISDGDITLEITRAYRDARGCYRWNTAHTDPLGDVETFSWDTDSQGTGLWRAITGGRVRQVLGYLDFTYSSAAKRAAMCACYDLTDGE